MPTTLAMAILSLWASGACSVPSPSGDPSALAAAAAELAARRHDLDDPCRPAIELVLGETLLRLADVDQALPHLSSAALGPPARRGRAYNSLAEAQSLLGDYSDALRSLGQAQRLLPAADPVRSAAVDRATLITRLILRRGGSLWGAYRFDAGYSAGSDLIGIAAGGGRVAGIHRTGWLDLEPAGSTNPLARRPVAMTLNRNGTWAVLSDDGALHRAGGSIPLVEDDVARKVQAIALAADDSILLLHRGQVLNYLADGSFNGSFEPSAKAIDLAVDPGGRIHLLLDGAGIAVLDHNQRLVRTIPTTGDGWKYDDPIAIATDDIGATYVLTEDPPAIQVFDPDGGYSGRIDPPGHERKLFKRARDLAVDKAGAVYVVVHRGRLARYR